MAGYAGGFVLAPFGRLRRGPSGILPLQSPLYGESLWLQEMSVANNSAPSYIHTGLDGIDGRCDEGCCVGAGADGQPCSCDDGCDDFSNMVSLCDSTVSRAVWWMYGGAKGLVMWY